MAAPYNLIYGKLVKDPKDLVGLIAYALYKREKSQFIDGIKAETKAAPTDADISAFILNSNVPARLESYRSDAEDLLTRFSDEILEDQALDLHDAYRDNLVDELKKARPFWNGVIESLAATGVALVATAVIVVVVWSMRFGFGHVVEQAFNVKITPVESAIAATPSAPTLPPVEPAPAKPVKPAAKQKS